MISSLVVLTFYLAFPRMRTHTNGVLFWRTVCDFGLACTFMYYCVMALKRGGVKQESGEEEAAWEF
jgi:hypothetical protein